MSLVGESVRPGRQRDADARARVADRDADAALAVQQPRRRDEVEGPVARAPETDAWRRGEGEEEKIQKYKFSKVEQHVRKTMRKHQVIKCNNSARE